MKPLIFNWSDYEMNIAQGCLTNSKHPRSFVDGPYPKILRHTHSGCLFRGYDGKDYIDYLCALGSNLIGYGNPTLNLHLISAISAGHGFCGSLAAHYEIESAEAIKSLFPFIERVKFVLSGSDACSAAIRMARAYTNRVTVLSEGYHGWHDEFVSLTPPAHGVPARISIDPLIDLNQIDDNIAAVIVEPVMLDYSNERVKYLAALRNVCKAHGVVLIFDEIITGFRYLNHSVSKAYSIIPDLICLGKAMGSGFPIAAVGGRKELLDNSEYFVSSTNAGFTLAHIAVAKTIDILKKESSYKIENLWNEGNKFIMHFNNINNSIIKIEGYPTRGSFVGSDINVALFCQEAIRCGIFFHPKTWFYNASLVDHFDRVLSSCKDIIGKIGRKEVALYGKMPTSPFSTRVRENVKS